MKLMVQSGIICFQCFRSHGNTKLWSCRCSVVREGLWGLETSRNISGKPIE